MWIKIILLAGLALVVTLGFRRPRGARHQALRRIMMLAFAAFAAASVVFPEIWNGAANAVGVGRGTDLLLYMLIVGCLLYVASSYLRFRDLESQITRLARRLALDEVERRATSREETQASQPTKPAMPS